MPGGESTYEEVTRKVGGMITMCFTCRTMEFGFYPIDNAEAVKHFNRWTGPKFRFKITLAVV